MIMAASGEQVGKFGHCPFFKFGCMLKTDGDDKPIVSKMKYSYEANFYKTLKKTYLKELTVQGYSSYIL